MTAEQIILAFKSLSPAEKAEVIKAILAEDDSWIPESFIQGMADFEAGRFVDMEIALTQSPPGA